MAEGRTWEITKAYDELMELLEDFDDEFMTGPNHVADDEQLVVMGYKWIFSILQVAMDVYLWGDVAAPRFVDIVGPYKKWGGDNTDAYYQFAPVDPARTYKVTGTAGDAVYFSLTVYGGPNDGNYTTRIVGIVNNRDLELGPNGEFEFLMGPEKPAGYDGVFTGDQRRRRPRHHPGLPGRCPHREAGRVEAWRPRTVPPPSGSPTRTRPAVSGPSSPG